MSRALATAALLVIALVPGCLQDTDASADLRAVFGEDAVEQSNGTTQVVAPVLEGQVLGGVSWEPRANLTIDVPKITLQKTDPGPQGGGGTTHELVLPTAASAVMVRFKNADKLGGYDAHWSVVRAANDTLDWSQPKSAKEAFEVTVDTPGPRFVAVELLKGGSVAARVVTPFIATLNVHWVIESSVRPVKASGAPQPVNYEQMADEFPFEVPVEGARVTLETKFRGTFDPSKGTDVDLELAKPDGTPHSCSGSGGGGGTPLGSPGDTEQASEKVEAEIGQGTWAARVGAMRYGGENCGSDFAYYNNAGTVPYTLDVKLEF